MTARTDPGHAAGNQVYRPPLPPCECGHLDGVHNITINGRGRCTGGFASGYCPCRGYTPTELALPDAAAEPRPASGGATNGNPPDKVPPRPQQRRGGGSDDCGSPYEAPYQPGPT